MVNAPGNANGGHYRPGTIVMYNGEQYTVVEFLGEILEIDRIDNELVVVSNDKYKLRSNDGDIIEVVDHGDIMIVPNNNNNNQNGLMIVNNNNMQGGRIYKSKRNNKRTYRKKTKKSKRSRRH